MLTDCPHCFTRVVPKADGTCPACQRDIHESGSHDPNMVSMKIAQGDELPSVCCQCGLATDRLIRLHKTSAGKDGLPTTFWEHLVARIAGLFAPIRAISMLETMFEGSQATIGVDVDLPLCDLCRAQGVPDPIYVDFANARMTLIVHRTFREKASCSTSAT